MDAHLRLHDHMLKDMNPKPHFSEHDVLFPGGNVFRNFLQDSDATNRPHDLAAIRLKSAALYAHACYLATQWYTGKQPSPPKITIF